MIDEQILVNITPYETRVAMIQNGTTQELHLERTHTEGLVGNLYLGKVLRVLPGMQSAFIDIGLERSGFLHVTDLWEQRLQQHQTNNKPQTPYLIEKMLFEGQSLLVQVSKDPIGKKGAKLTTQISLAGRLLVYVPQDNHIGVSQRIEDETERELLRHRLENLAGVQREGGYILRTQAELASNDELIADIHYLKRRWVDILDLTRKKAAPSLLYKELNMAERVIRDFVSHATNSVTVDCAVTYSALKKFAETYAPEVSQKLFLHQGDRSLFEFYNIEEELKKALGRRVDLKSGGYLIIDQTEAMTTVDVNTGGFVGARNFEETIFKTNLEAAQSIARQLRLRNLGGIVVIDFIDMVNTKHQEQVLDALNQALSKDRARCNVSEFSKLGLVELTRKRTRDSLSNLLCEACPLCQGRGQVKTAQTICYEILREVQTESRQFNPRQFIILANPTVINLLLEEEADHLAQLEAQIGTPITLQVETSFAQEDYDIILA